MKAEGGRRKGEGNGGKSLSANASKTFVCFNQCVKYYAANGRKGGEWKEKREKKDSENGRIRRFSCAVCAFLAALAYNLSASLFFPFLLTPYASVFSCCSFVCASPLLCSPFLPLFALT